MRITLTGRRLALAAVLVLSGVAAPLAYATIGNGNKAGNAPTQKPTRVLGPTVQTAPTAVGDPYQRAYEIGVGGSTCLSSLALPATPFVLESVSVMNYAGVGTLTSFQLGLTFKTGGGASGAEDDVFNIPLDADGDGREFFNLLIRPNTFTNAASGDIYDLSFCVTSTGGTTFALILTGKVAPASGPTPAQVSSFDATSGKTGATLHWKTASETTILGFNVWRYRGAKGVKVNRTLVRAKRSGEPRGATYRYVDHVAVAKRGLTYRLQLVDLKGKRTWYAAFAIASK
jgi:hypothetical protein